ncbi:MAG: hypothetical protein ACRES7_09570 [Gammaproteobacteria bacterium]
MDYLEWNDRIGAHFFTPDKAGQRVFLFVTEDMIKTLGVPSPDPVGDFITAAKTGPPWATRQGLCMRAIQAFTNWRSRGREYPPYLTSLALFVLAAGQAGDFAPHAYYPRLRTLLGDRPDTGQIPSFHRMQILWKDLANWTQDDKGGQLGIFETYRSGSWEHVGLPQAQMLLTDDELQNLPGIFATAGLDPTATPSDQELLADIARYGTGRLRPVTVDFARRPQGIPVELMRIIVDVLLDELHAWDGKLAVQGEEGEEKERVRVAGSLLICCQVNRVLKTCQLSLRCKSKRNIPDDGMVLVDEGQHTRLQCEPSAQDWSTPLALDDGSSFDPAVLDWCSRASYTDETGTQTYSLRGSPVRILAKGVDQGLPGEVEVNRLPVGGTMMLLVHDTCMDLIRRWGTGSCTGYTEIDINRGLPANWRLVSIQSVRSDQDVHDRFPMLGLPLSDRINLNGGIRTGPGITFFNFARPTVSVETAHEQIRLLCDETQLEAVNTGYFRLPENLPVESMCTLTAFADDIEIQRRSLKLADAGPWKFVEPLRQLDHFGVWQNGVGNATRSVAGAVVVSAELLKFNYNTLPECSLYRRVLFIGRLPGQFADWPDEPFPGWMPVWAIPMFPLKRGKAIFCGPDLESCMPLPDDKTATPRNRKHWIEVLWHMRKRITPPSKHIERSLWDKYVSVAKNV